MEEAGLRTVDIPMNKKKANIRDICGYRKYAGIISDHALVRADKN